MSLSHMHILYINTNIYCIAVIPYVFDSAEQDLDFFQNQDQFIQVCNFVVNELWKFGIRPLCKQLFVNILHIYVVWLHKM